MPAASRKSNRPVFYTTVFFLIGMILGILYERHLVAVQPPEPPGNPPPQKISTDGRTEVDLAGISKNGLMVALVFGQSNSANYGEQRYTCKTKNVFNFYNKKVYAAADPLLGATGSGGSVWTRLGDRLVTRKIYNNVIFVPIGFGSSGIAQWVPGGGLHGRLTGAIEQVQACGLQFTHLLWHQGETDAFIVHTSKDDYQRYFTAMLESIRKTGVHAPIYISLASRGGRNRGNPEIVAAQKTLVNKKDIRPGPNTDNLGFAYRFDGIHFSIEGLDAFADLWLSIFARERSMPFSLPRADPDTASAN